MSFRTGFGRGAAFSVSTPRADLPGAPTRGDGNEWGSRPVVTPYDQRNDRQPPPTNRPAPAVFGSNRNLSPPPLPPRGAGTRLINPRQPSEYDPESRPQLRFPSRAVTREQSLYAPPTPLPRQNHQNGYDDVTRPLHTALTRPPPQSRWGNDSPTPNAAHVRDPPMNGYVMPPSTQDQYDRTRPPPSTQDQYDRTRPPPSTQDHYDRAPATQQPNAFQRHQYENPYAPPSRQYDDPEADRIRPPPPGLRLDDRQQPLPPNFGQNPRQPHQYAERQQPLPPIFEQNSRQPHQYVEQNRRQRSPSPLNQDVRDFEPQNEMRFEREPRQTRPQHNYGNTSTVPTPMPRPSRNVAPVEETRDYQNYFQAPSQPQRAREAQIPARERYPDESFNDENEDRVFNSNSSAATIRANPNNVVNAPAGNFGALNLRGGHHGNVRGAYSGFINGRNDFGGPANGGFNAAPRNNRYEDRRNSDAPPASNGYRGFNQQVDSQNRNRAQKGYVPHARNVEEIFDEDSQDVNQHANTIFDGDADIEVLGESVPQRCERWDDMFLDPQLLNNIGKSEYVKPRKIQQYVVPYMMDGFQIKCQSETGSGKTAAFLIPAVQKLIEDKRRGPLPMDGPIALIISPTRELTQQLYEQAKKFANGTGISVSYAYGQVDTSKNLADIRRGCNILCACLGRLIDFVESAHITLKNVRLLCIDEADRLMDNKEDNYGLLKLLNYPSLPKKEERQTCLFSATLKDPILEQLADQYIDDDKRIFIIAKNESNARIRYEVIPVPSIPTKFRYLICYLKQITEANNGHCPRVLIFVNRKINVDRVAIDITGKGFPATTIHGDRGQDLREEALASFKAGKTTCLVATDVCARGVDVKNLDYVINYDLPQDRTGFVQRCGRTGRTHNGVAVSFYCEANDSNMAQIIDEIIVDAGQHSPPFLRSYVQETDYPYEEHRAPEPHEAQAQQQNFSRHENDPSPIDSGLEQSRNNSPYTAQEQQIPDNDTDDGWN